MKPLHFVNIIIKMFVILV